MAMRLSGQTSICVVVPLYLFWELRDKRKFKKFTILTRKPVSHVKILIYRTWDGKTLFNKLQKLQNCATPVVTSSSYAAAVDFFFHKLSWNDFQSQRQIQKALMVFKSFNSLVPEYLTSEFVTRDESNYALRNSANKLVVPQLSEK